MGRLKKVKVNRDLGKAGEEDFLARLVSVYLLHMCVGGVINIGGRKESFCADIFVHAEVAGR